MFSFAGVPLSDPEGEEPGAWIEANIKPQELFPLAMQSWPQSWATSPNLNFSFEQPRPVIIGSFRWPRGASRFAVGYFVVSGPQLALIRKAIYGNGVQKPAAFVFSDGKTTLTTSLWMLPAVPLAKVVAGAEMYLLVLVDERYFWWGFAVDVSVAPGTTTWANLYSTIATALGVTITVDPVNAAYGTPPIDYQCGGRPLPSILDAVAWSCGQRIVRDYAGNVYARNVATATTQVTANLATAPVKYAGGAFDYNPRG